jgi:NAD(P)H dehydrogenase (quinone)
MRVFIVFAHAEPRSFNGALFRAAQETLRAAGHELLVSDLYAMQFEPVVDGGEDGMQSGRLTTNQAF